MSRVVLLSMDVVLGWSGVYVDDLVFVVVCGEEEKVRIEIC